MKYLVNAYTFDPAAKTITFSEAYALNQLLLVTNVNTNQIIYNFAAPGSGGSISGNVLTLDFDTTAMSSDDALQIFVEIEDTAPADSASLLMRILSMLMAPLGYDKSLQRFRQTAVVESGTITQVSTVATVSTVTNQGNIGGIQGQILPNSASLSAWHACVRTRIS